VLADGDEIALLPPVAGGAGLRKIAIRAEPLVVERGRGGHRTEPRRRRHVHRRRAPRGASPVRRRPPGRAYVEMAEQVLADIADGSNAMGRDAIAIHHRVGSLRSARSPSPSRRRRRTAPRRSGLPPPSTASGTGAHLKKETGASGGRGWVWDRDLKPRFNRNRRPRQRAHADGSRAIGGGRRHHR
jgi:hypothetical protein